jgi:hypothetical protein
VFGDSAVPVNENRFENSIPNPANRGSQICDAFARIVEGIVNAITSAASTTITGSANDANNNAERARRIPPSSAMLN